MMKLNYNNNIIYIAHGLQPNNRSGILTVEKAIECGGV